MLACAWAMPIAAAEPGPPQLIAEAKRLLEDYQLPKAEATVRRALAKLGQHPGKPAQQLKAHLLLGEILREQCRLSNARLHGRKALSLVPKLPAERQASRRLEVLRELALTAHERGQYLIAITRLEEGLALEKEIGKTSELAYALTELAGVQLEIGRYTQAQQSLARAQAMLPALVEKKRGPLLADIQNNLGLLHAARGDYKTSEFYYKRSLAWHTQNLGRKHLDTTIPRANLAVLYRDMGSHRRAEAMFKLNLNMTRAQVGERHIYTTLDLANLAGLYHDTDRLEEALPLYRKSLAITTQLLGPDHPYTGVDHSNLALAYSDHDDLERAEHHLAHARRILQKNPEAARTMGVSALQNLAAIYADQNDLANARRLYREALEVELKTSGDTSVDVANLLHHLALVEWRDRQPERARNLARQKYDIEKALIHNVFSFTSEEERLAFVEKLQPLYPLINLGAAADIAPLVLERKAMVLDSLLRNTATARAATSPAIRALEQQIRESSQHLVHEKTALALLLDAPDANRTAISAARWRVGTAQTQLHRLNKSYARAAQQPELPGPLEPRVRAALPANSVLIEYIEFDQYQTENSPDPRWVRDIGALILPPAGPAQWKVLGRARASRTLLAQYAPTHPATEAEYEAVLKQLHQKLIAPLQEMLPTGTRTLVIAPDSQLNFLNFSTLLNTQNKFLCEDYEILHISTGRDLARMLPAPRAAQLAVFAQPSFGPAGEQAVQRNPRLAALQDLSFAPLPGTGREAAFLRQAAPGWKLQPQMFIEAEATEANLRQLRGPFILHLATHGFFIEQKRNRPLSPIVEYAAADTLRKSRPDPRLLRSGLALSGAANTLRRWQAGEVPAAANDGILTADEVRLLQLEGNWLTVLSACETGAGTVRAGEGVIGLRRAFARAGTQNLLFTLWPISDQVTVELMQSFYRTAMKDRDAARALHRVQRDQLVKLRAEEGTKLAVQLAGPFLLTTQGSLRETE